MGADIFLSYARVDISVARQLAEALQTKGWSVWWDASIKAGESFDEVIQKNLESARAVIVLWSNTSITRRWVKNEARFAQSMGILVPVIIDDVAIPLEFSDLQSVYLGRWRGQDDDPNYTQLIEFLTLILNPGRTTEEKQVKPFIANARNSTIVTGASVGVDPNALSDLNAFRDVKESWCPEMVVLPEGEFLMGSPETDRDAYPDEKPQHLVTFSYRFAIARYLTTFVEYDLFAKATGRDYPGDSTWGRAKRPVINISWEDAVAYSEWLSLMTNRDYRLPSEAEWEYACRAHTGWRYAFGDEITEEFANFGGTLGKTTLVGSYEANPWGLYDTHGNVCEWVEDTWHDNYDLAPVDGSAWTDEEGAMFRIIRGGCWNDYQRTTRAAVRGREQATRRYNFVGFRVVRNL